MAQVVIVSQQGNYIGEEDYFSALEQGLIRKVVRIFLVNSQEQLFLQKRGSQVYLYPGCWDSSAAGHVDPGEDAITAAHRETREELGISGLVFSKQNEFYNEAFWQDKILRSYDTLFVAKYDGPFALSAKEVSGGRWLTPAEIEKDIAKSPSDYSSGFINSFRQYLTGVNSPPRPNRRFIKEASSNK